MSKISILSVLLALLSSAAFAAEALDKTAKQAISGDMMQLKSSLEEAQRLVSQLKTATNTLDSNRISRKINLVAREVSLERQYLQDKAKTTPAVQNSLDYQNLLGDVSSFEMSAKELPSTAHNVDQELALSLKDVKRLS